MDAFLFGKANTMDDNTDLDQLRERWLSAFDSQHTRRAYARALNQWSSFLLEHERWLLEGDTNAMAAAWKDHLQHECELAAASVNQRLAAVSSFYEFLARDKIVDENGVERSRFVDAAGRPRENPFRSGNSRRAAQGPGVRNTNPLTPAQISAMREACNRNTRVGARDFALLECFIRTGRRRQEIQRLRIGDIHESAKGNLTFDWVGKGGKRGRRAFPRLAYLAIVDYLEADGRWRPGQMDPDMYVFQPLAMPGLVGPQPANQPISTGQVCRIVKKLARRGGLPDWREITPHRLRHTVAHLLYGQTKDAKLVMELLDHNDLHTTMIYLETMQEPEDRFSAALEIAYGF